MTEDMENMDRGEVTDNDRLWSLLCYVFPLVALIAMLMEDQKNRPFIKYNAIHGLLFAGVIFITSFTVCGWALVWIYAIYVGFQAYQGKWVEVPVLTNLAKGQGWV